MMNLSSVVTSMRLRTLPLSLAGVLLGIMLAFADGAPLNIPVVVLIITTTLSLQILSNLSNELGDFLSGTDTDERQGKKYSLQEGGLGTGEFKILIGIFIALCCISGLALVWCSYGTVIDVEPAMMLLLGFFAIQAAVKYTLGKNPYGYRGLGDFSVFTFFGMVSVLGSFFMLRHTIPSWKFILPAATMGFFSVGVLNVNNIRDMESDAKTRITMPLRMGERNAKIYQTALITAGWACIIAFTCMFIADAWHWLYVITLPAYILHLIAVWKNTGKGLDAQVPLLVMSTFLFSILCGVGFMMFLWL